MKIPNKAYGVFRDCGTIYYLPSPLAREDRELKIPKWLKVLLDHEQAEAFERGKRDIINKIHGLLDL